MSNLARIHFDAEAHRYSLDGRILPSVTQVLDVLGAYDGVPESMLKRARRIGQDVHTAIELIEEGTLDDASVEADTWEFVTQYSMWRARTRPVVLACEGMVFDDVFGFAGTIDLYAMIDGAPWLLDIKTPAQAQRTWPLQLWAYLEAARRNGIRARDGQITTIDPATRLGVLRLRPDGAAMIPVDSTAGVGPIFISALNVLRWRKEL